MNPDAVFKIVPLSATINAKRPDGENWDAFASPPDARVRMTCPSTASSFSLESNEASDTYTPVWATFIGSCSMKAKDLLAGGAGFAISVDDIDAAIGDVILPQSTFNLTEAIFVGGTAEVANVSGIQKLTLKVTPQ